jgi:hypothetical protein
LKRKVLPAVFGVLTTRKCEHAPRRRRRRSYNNARFCLYFDAFEEALLEFVDGCQGELRVDLRELNVPARVVLPNLRHHAQNSKKK